MRKRWRTWALTALFVLPAASRLSAAPSPAPSRQAEIREQAKGLLAARLKADVGLTDAQVGEVLPRLEAIEESRRESQRARRRLLSALRRDLERGAPDTSLQARLDELERNERDQDHRTREAISRIDGTLSVPQRVRLRFLLARFRGELTRVAIREGRRGDR